MKRFRLLADLVLGLAVGFLIGYSSTLINSDNEFRAQEHQQTTEPLALLR
jgi:hypothetical protein